MKTEPFSSQSPPLEFLTVEQLSERLQVSRATLFNWMQKGVLALGRHYFKRGRILRFIWSSELIQELLGGSGEDSVERSPVKPSVRPIKQQKPSPVNWEY